jgi:hypothetical protein
MSSYYNHSLVNAPPPPPSVSQLHSTGANNYGQSATTTPFRASNLAISSHHHQLHHGFHADAKHPLQANKEHQQPSQLSYLSHQQHHHSGEHLANSSAANTANNSSDNNGDNGSAGGVAASSFVDCYASPSVGHHGHHHHGSHHQLGHHHHHHHAAWPLNGSANSSCASRGCNSESVPPLARHHLSHHNHLHGQQQLHHQQPTMGPGNLQQQNGHYGEQHDSPHKSHHSNDSPQSCYSSSRFRDNNNTMSSYSSQIPQQQDLFDEPLGLSLGSLPTANQHQSQHQPHPDDSLHGQAPALSLKSDCAEVIAWLLANRFALFTKTFAQFSGSDLLRLSKSELIEICGAADGIRLFNSLHNAPCIKAKRKNFRTIKFAQIKRELRIKRKLK